MSNHKGNHNACFICLRTPIKYPSISLHRFPSNFYQRSLWLEACGLDEQDYRSSRRVCSFHFKNDCFHTTYLRKSLKPGSLPTIFTKEDFEEYKKSVIEQSELAKKKRKKKKNKKKKKKKEKKNEEPSEKLFCPETMCRYDDLPNGYKTAWVCRICLAFLFSTDAVRNHLIHCNLISEVEIDQAVNPKQNILFTKATEIYARESSTSEYIPSSSDNSCTNDGGSNSDSFSDTDSE